MIRPPDGKTAAIVRSGLSLGNVIILRGLASIGGIALSVVISRAAGAEVLGSTTFALSVASLLAVLGRWGLDTSLMKHVSGSLAKQNLGTLPVALRHTLARTGVLGGAMTALIVAAWLLWPEYWNELFGESGLILLATLPLTFFAVTAGYVKGLRHVAMSGMMDLGILSFVTSGVLLLALYYRSSMDIELLISIIFLSVTLFCVFMSLWGCFSHASKIKNDNMDAFDKADFQKGSLYFTLITVSIFATQAGSFAVVGPFMGEVEIGYARAAERLALLVSFPLTAINLFLSPRIVHHKTLGDTPALRSLMRRACLASSALAFFPALVLIAFPGFFLNIFGQGMDIATPSLIIFTITQFFIGATGPFGMLLFLDGSERLLGKIMLFTLLLCLVMYPIGGALGGAIGFAVAYAVVNILKAFLLLYFGLKRTEI